LLSGINLWKIWRLKYDLHICLHKWRRRLQESQAEQLILEKEAYADALFGNEELLNKRLERVIPNTGSV